MRQARRRTRRVGSFAALVGVIGSMTVLAPPTASAIPTGFEDTLVAGISQPMDMDWTPDGRMLVTTKAGQIRVLVDEELLPTPALDLSASVCTSVEQGLAGIVVHPDFVLNGYVYVYRTHAKFGACGVEQPVNRLSRFVLPPSNIIDPASEVVLFDTSQVLASGNGHHNGGDLAFGPDGFLYVTLGEANKGTWADDLDRLQGKIVRLTADGAIPPGNPYTGAGTARCHVDGVVPAGSPAGTKCQEIYASGLRNPFKFTLDPTSPTTRFLINDVGGEFWEEIDELTEPGADFGWPTREGPCAKSSETSCTPDARFTEPLHWYDHQGIGGAITGGAFVPPGVWPAEYEDRYLFADYVFGTIYRLDDGGPDCRLCVPPTSPYVQTEITAAPRIVDMAFAPYEDTQALYYLSREENEVRRILYTGSANRLPQAVAAATPAYGSLPLSVSFDGSGSSDPDLDSLTYAWDFGDGSPVDTTASPTHVFTEPGTYEVELTVDDGRGGVDSAIVVVDAGNLPPVPVIEAPLAGHEFAVGETITLTGSATDPEDGPLADVDLTWEVRQHHHTHYHPYLDPTPGNGLTVVAPAPEDVFSTEDSHIEVLLTATDSNGLSATVSQDVDPRLVDLAFETAPAGLDLIVEGQQVATPLAVVAWEGWTLALDAPDQPYGSETYVWSAWSQGGTRAQTFTVGSAATTLVATFGPPGPPLITPGAVSVTEGDAGTVVASVPVTLERAAAAPVTVDWTTADIPTSPSVAHPGSDYVAASGTLTFAPGETSKTIDVSVLGDLVDEPPLFGGEWGLVSLSNASANAAIDVSFFGLGIFSIVDDDPAPTISPVPVSVDEGDAGSVFVDLPVTLSNPSAVSVTVDWTTFDMPASPSVAHPGSDYVAASGTLTFAPGETSQDIRIEVLGDTEVEPPLLGGEWGLVVLSNATGAVIDLSFYGIGVFSIVDDD